MRPDPLREELLRELRTAWGFAPDAPLIVIGQLAALQRGEGATVIFLESLEHPVSGVGLTYPLSDDTARDRAYVPPSEIRRLKDPQGALSKRRWVVAELQLSLLEHRTKQKNPHACAVRPGTLRLLSDVPEDWNVLVSGVESARRITAAAREAIGGRIRQEQAQLLDELAQIHKGVSQAEALRSGKEQELEALQEAVRSERLRLDDLNAHVLRETRHMEDRFRRLREMLAVKGDRLVALGLIDASDRDALLPKGGIPDMPPGHDFQEALDGDFARLAPYIQARLHKLRMLYSQAQLRDFLALLRTHDLIVLAGDSGSGKTSLVRAVADSIGARWKVIPVKPNWTGPEDLLGYYNPIGRTYQPTPFLQALQAARDEPDVLHLICLDEMNLARVEHYFADFLSYLEVRGRTPEIHLYASDEERHAVVETGLFLAIEAEVRARSGLPDGTTFVDLLRNDQANALLCQLGGFRESDPVLLHHARLRRALAALARTPTSLPFPPNVRIIGAVNVDETTHYLSPKVLDRAHVLRFRNPVLLDWQALDAEVEDFDLDLDTPMRLSAQDFGPRGDYPPFDRDDEATAWLADLARDHLDPLGVEFGFRAIRQAANYMREAEVVGIGALAALNNVVLHKVLPKLTVDTSRTIGDGRKKGDILAAFQRELRDRMAGLDPKEVTESCADAVDRIVAAVDGNNGVANYWLR